MPFQQPKSLKMLLEELVDTRLAAGNNSLWSIGITMEERGRVAINDAIREYPFVVRETHQSVIFTPQLRQVVIPRRAEKVIEIYAYHVSDATTEIQVTEFRHAPTVFTNLLRLEIPQYAMQSSNAQASPTFWISVDYEHYTREMPQSRYCFQPDIDAGTLLNVEQPGTLGAEWPSEGIIEIRHPTVVSIREYAHYNSISSGTVFVASGGVFLNVRGLFDSNPRYWPTSSSARMYPVAWFPAQALAVLMPAAEANMYKYWLTHRADYVQFATAAGVQQLDVEEILLIVSTLERQAKERYALVAPLPEKHIPKPTKMRLRRRSDI